MYCTDDSPDSQWTSEEDVEDSSLCAGHTGTLMMCYIGHMEGMSLQPRKQ